MLSFFLNPVTMIAGAILVSSPIIIHLINRMRFRRVKWAAMEFLLKAQKRMRRKMIIEQLILLFLRCLLVFLVGLLFARFLGFDPMHGKETRPTVHVVVLDDSPSMADKGRTEGVTTDAFEEAKKQITDRIMPAALEASTTQSIRIVRLSDLVDLMNPDPDPAKDLGPAKINSQLIEEVRGKLGGQKVSSVRVSLVDGLKRAKELVEKAGGAADTAKVVHVVSDLRAIDWEVDGVGLTDAIRQMSEAGIKVHLIDVATPSRPTDKSKPLAYSDNVGIVEFKPRTRVAAADEPVDFEVRLKNFGTTDLKDVQVYFYRNGQGHIIQELPFPHLPAGQERTYIAQVTFNREDEPKEKSLTPEQLKKEMEQRFQLVTAVIASTGNDGLLADNTRHAIVEVRKKLSVLVIPGPDEDVTKPPQKSNDTFYLRKLFQDSFRGINWVAAKADALDKHDLRQYSTIFLVNVPRLSESQAKNLDAYVREGGGIGVFLGKDVDAISYNKLLHNAGAGFFPVPLPDKPTDELTPEQKNKRVFSKRVLLRESGVKMHPALSGMYTNERGDPDKQDIERYFYFLNIDQHWPISRLGRWREDKSVQELYCLPNEKPVSEYENRLRTMREAVTTKYGEPKFEKYRDLVSKLLEELRVSAASPDTALPVLARQLDQLLADQVNDGTPEEALLREFWGQPEMGEAKAMAQALRDETKYGDPLYFAKRYYNGRVAVMTTDAGATYKNVKNEDVMWNDWSSGAGAAGWVAVMKEMQKYLAGGGAEENRSVGSTYSVSLDASRYSPTVSRTFLTADTTPSKSDRGSAPLERKDLGDQTLVTNSGALQLNFSDTKPGAYIFTLSPTQGDGQPAKPPEHVATVFNIDTAREGALQRAKGNDLADQAKGAEVHAADDTTWLDTLKQKQTDMSSGRWIYLVILLVLILEQAMAVRLSYHTRPEDLDAFAPSAAAVFSHGTPPSAMDAEAAVASTSVGSET